MLQSSDPSSQSLSPLATNLIGFASIGLHCIADDALSDGLHQFWCKDVISLVSERWHCCNNGSVAKLSDLNQGLVVQRQLTCHFDWNQKFVENNLMKDQNSTHSNYGSRFCTPLGSNRYLQHQHHAVV